MAFFPVDPQHLADDIPANGDEIAQVADTSWRNLRNVDHTLLMEFQQIHEHGIGKYLSYFAKDNLVLVRQSLTAVEHGTRAEEGVFKKASISKYQHLG